MTFKSGLLWHKIDHHNCFFQFSQTANTLHWFWNQIFCLCPRTTVFPFSEFHHAKPDGKGHKTSSHSIFPWQTSSKSRKIVSTEYSIHWWRKFTKNYFPILVSFKCSNWFWSAMSNSRAIVWSTFCKILSIRNANSFNFRLWNIHASFENKIFTLLLSLRLAFRIRIFNWYLEKKCL